MALSTMSTMSSNIIRNGTHYRYLIGSTNPNFIYSSDRNDWQSIDASSNQLFQTTTSFIKKDDIIIASGISNNNSSYYTLAYSNNNGINWTPISQSNSFNWSATCIAYSPSLNRFVAVGRGNRGIATSSNGKKWSAEGITNTLGTDITVFVRGRGVTWGNNIFVAVGDVDNIPSTYSINTSTDGKAWKQVNKSIF